MRPRLLLLPFALVLLTGSTRAQPATDRSCVVIFDSATGQTWRSDATACATRFAPASTFKIPHALVGLETGVITTATSEPWDGTPYPNQPEWQHAHTVLTSLRPSVLWFYQRMAPRIGAARMHDWLAQLHYGNADTSGDVKQYWLNGTLRVSPDEQVTFLRSFFSGTLPFQPSFQRQVREALLQQTGTVQNARGVHKLEGRWDSTTALISKTGQTTSADGERVSWLVGQLTTRVASYVFASVVARQREVDGLDGTRLAVRTFLERGVLSR